jgi:glycosyltransferase involved in cell wall biosynthesis
MVIWVVSKYVLVPQNNKRGSRQYYYSKYFAREGNKVSLIGSMSCSADTDTKGLEKKWYGYYGKIEQVDNYIMRGPKVGLGFNLKRMYSWLVFEMWLFLYILFAKKQKPDVIIVSSLSLITIINGVLAKFLFKSKLVFEVRDIWPKTLVELGGWSKRNILVKILNIIESFGYKHANIIVGSMANLKEHVREKKPEWGDKVYWAPMGYDFEEVRTDDTPHEILAKIPQGKFIAGYAGTIGLANVVEEIVMAAHELKDREDVHFVLAGDGSHKQECEKLAEGLTNITFLGKIPKDKVNSVLQHCHVLLCPTRDLSLYRYGMSLNKWIDYMYSGKPIICPYNGYRSLLDEAQCGEFIEPHNKKILAETILKYKAMPANEIEEMGRRGKAFLEQNLNYSILAKKYLDIIKSHKN